jgi:environmental stress-induced protein Ves
MKVLRAEDYAAVPWKNGGGVTREIALHRDARLHEDFLWRLSIATVARPGPFSRFDGVDRSIAVLSGEGMLLHCRGESVRVDAGTPPFSFDGEIEISSELLGGPTLDLNAMTRRNFFRHAMRRAQFSGGMTVKGTADLTLVVSNGVIELHAEDRGYLRPHDTVTDIFPGTMFELHAERATHIFIVELMRP